MKSEVHSQASMICGCGACADSTTADRHQPFSRRRFMAGAVTAAALPAALNFATAGKALAQSTMTPDEALQELVAGNKRFVDGKLTSFEHDLAILKKNNAEKQEPFAAILSCADSRVPVELVFDQSIGHLFVTRVAGNIASAEMIASLEYGAAVLGTKAILVLGHSSCGAVKASIAAQAVPGQISTLYRYIRPAVDQAGSDYNAVGRANAKIQAAILSEASPVLAERIKQHNLKIAAGFYDLKTGKVEMLS